MSKDTYIDKFQRVASDYTEYSQIINGAPSTRNATEYDPESGEGSIVAITDFDFSSVESELFGVESKEDSVQFSDMAAGLGIILEWIATGSGKHKTATKPSSIAARALALVYLLHPELLARLGFDSLQSIADHCGCTKSAISHSLMGLRDQTGLKLTLGKMASSRETFRESTLRSIETGSHSRYSRKDAVKRRPEKLAS